MNRNLQSVNPRTEWLLWFGGLSVAALAVAWFFSGSSPGTAGTLVELLIVGLFVATLVKSYLDISRLERETVLASRQVEEMRQHKDLARFLESASASIFRSHIQSLHTIFLSHSQVSQDTILEIAQARLQARNRVVELLASILITLGLIGTILGLLISVDGLQVVLEAPAAAGGEGAGDAAGAPPVDGIVSGLKTTVAGLGVSFYTTLFGAAAGGVVLRILTSVVDSHIMRYVAHLSELTEVYVLPALRRTAAQMEAEGYYRGLDGSR